MTIVDAAALGAELRPERKGRHGASSYPGLGSMVDLPLGLGIVQRISKLGSGGRD